MEINSDLIFEITKLVMLQLESMESDSYLVYNNLRIPVGVSVRHVHLTQKHLEVLFGEGFCLTKKSDLSQPGQFAANEMLTLKTPKSEIKNVRILGPVRNVSQVEISLSDARKLGINPPVRTSGDIKKSPGIILVGPKASVQLDTGVIIAERHIHMTPEDGKLFNVTNNQNVDVKVGGNRGGILGNVSVHIDNNAKLDFHIDTDDANGFGLSQGDFVEIDII